LKVLRPYGSIGPLDWQDSPGTAFGGEANNLLSIADRIRTYSEEEESGDAGNIKSAITTARTIVILGFGYHKQNIDILRIPGGINSRNIFMTTLGISEDNDDDIANAVRVCMQSQIPPRNYKYEGSTFMVRLRPSLVMATS
jgi:hypothetical protein